MDQPSFYTSVVTGPALLALSENVRGWQKRDCYGQLNAYLHSMERDRVCLLYGLRRTGKTTLLRQVVLDMSQRTRREPPTSKQLQRTLWRC